MNTTLDRILLHSHIKVSQTWFKILHYQTLNICQLVIFVGSKASCSDGRSFTKGPLELENFSYMCSIENKFGWFAYP